VWNACLLLVLRNVETEKMKKTNTEDEKGRRVPFSTAASS